MGQDYFYNNKTGIESTNGVPLALCNEQLLLDANEKVFHPTEREMTQEPHCLTRASDWMFYDLLFT